MNIPWKTTEDMVKSIFQYYSQTKMKRKASTAIDRPFKKPRLVRQNALPSLINPKTLKSGPEQKNIDTVANSAFVAGATTGVLTLLNGVDDGTTSTTRIGRKIIMKSLMYRFSVQLASTTVGGAALRNLIVYDKQANAAAPAITDIVQVDAIYANMNLANSSRFIVISDELIPCIGTAGPQAHLSTRYMKLNLPVEFNDNSTALINSITTGSIYLIQWQGGGLATTAPANVLNSRIRFIDQ